MFGIEKDFQQLMEQAYGPLGEKQMTEIEELKAQIKVLQSKLSFLEELEKTKSPAEEAYKDWYGEYPLTNWKCEVTRWETFQAGYNFAQRDYKVGKYQETTQEQRERLRKDVERIAKENLEWFKKKHPNESVEDYLTPKNPEKRKIDEEDNDKNSLEIIKEWGEKNKPLTLYQLIEDWWCDVFCANSTDDMETCIDELVSRIDNQFIPPSHDTNDYQWNKCLKMMREKLR